MAWAVTHKITQVAINDLLTVLRDDHPSLPLDARTLLRNVKSGNM